MHSKGNKSSVLTPTWALVQRKLPDCHLAKLQCSRPRNINADVARPQRMLTLKLDGATEGGSLGGGHGRSACLVVGDPGAYPGPNNSICQTFAYGYSANAKYV